MPVSFRITSPGLDVSHPLWLDALNAGYAVLAVRFGLVTRSPLCSETAPRLCFTCKNKPIAVLRPFIVF